MFERRIIFAIILITFLGAFLRLYKITEYPVHLGHDEVTQLYDAISIAETGKDIYGNFMPFIFQSVNDYKPPFYTYATALTYLLIGDREALTIRLPGILFGIALIPMVFLLAWQLFKNQKIALLSAFLTAIAPFEIFFSRKSFENGAGIFLMSLGFYFLLKYLNLNVKSSPKWLFFAAISLGIAMYTYFSHAIIIPILLAVFLLIFRKDFPGKLKTYLKPALIFLAIVTPLFLIILFNQESRNRSAAVFLTQDPILGQNSKLVDSDILKFKTIFDYSFSRYIDQFSPDYIFGNGLDFTNQSPLGIGPLYIFQLPLLLIGIFYLLREQNLTKQKKFILAWILIGIIPSALTFESHSPHRSIMVFTMLNIISAAGFYFLFSLLPKYRNLQYISVVAVGFVILANMAYFAHMYFVNLPFEKSQYLHYPFKQVAQFAGEQYPNFEKIVFDPKFGDPTPFIGTGAQYYLAYYGKMKPSQFQAAYQKNDKGEISFDKFTIRAVNYDHDRFLKNSLIIASPWSLPLDSLPKERIIKTFYFYNGQIAFYALRI